MTTHVATLNATRGEIEEALLAGKSPAEAAQHLQEPMPNVLQIYRDLRDDGRIAATNHPAAPPTSNGHQPTRPVHTPNADLTARIAGTTDLLVKAADIDDKRIQNALGRARKTMTDLAGLVTAWESKSAARNRIARLEAELRIAKAELRGEPGTTTQGASPKKERTAAQTAALEKAQAAAREPVDCPDCGKTCSTRGGLSAHKRGNTCTSAT